MQRGRIHQINLSPGGVPKLAVEAADVVGEGLVGDGHDDTRHHGGPARAVCLYSLEVIRGLRAEGHPIAPGTTGENVTVEGLDWTLAAPGARFRFEGGVELEVTDYTTPCSTIRASFIDAAINRIRHADHPGFSRVYARVLTPGRLRRGESVTLSPAPATPVAAGPDREG